MSEFHLAFSGTRKGMNLLQVEQLAVFFEQVKPTWLHHGSCQGSDVQAHNLAVSLGIKTVAYPAIGTKDRAVVKADITHAADLPLSRNQRLVEAARYLVITPRADFEEVRSGTWAAARYARRTGKRLVIIWPNGEVS